MIALPLRLPGACSDDAQGGTGPGNAGESPGPEQMLAAATAFLPILMHLLQSPQHRVAYPAPNREESATTQTTAEAGGLHTATADDSAPVPGAGTPVPAVLQRADTFSFPAVLTKADPAGRETALRVLSAVPPRDARPENTSAPKPGPLQIAPDAGAAAIPPIASAGPEQPAAPVNGTPDSARVVIHLSRPRGNGGAEAVATPPAGADFPRLMADVIALQRPVPARSPAQEPAELPVPPAAPADPEPECSPARVAALSAREKAPGPVTRPPAEPPADRTRTAVARATPDDSPGSTVEHSEPATVGRGAPPRPATDQQAVPRAPAPERQVARTAERHSRPETGGPESRPSSGQTRETLRNLFPLLQQGRGTDAVRVKPAERSGSVSGLPRELVSSILDRVVRELVITGARGGTEARLALKPESLGELVVHIAMDDNVMTAKIEVTQPSAKAVLDAGMPQLREALAARGIAVQQIDVFTSPDAFPRQGREQRDARQRQAGGRRPATAAAEAVALPRMLGYNTIELSM